MGNKINENVFHYHLEAEYCFQKACISVLTYKEESFLNSFKLLKLSILNHCAKEESCFKSEEIENIIHKQSHDFLWKKLIKYEKIVLEESASGRIHILSVVQNWLISHSLKFDEKCVNFSVRETK